MASKATSDSWVLLKTPPSSSRWRLVKVYPLTGNMVWASRSGKLFLQMDDKWYRRATGGK